jgi:BMFP domain-containing protein YqiC
MSDRKPKPDPIGSVSSTLGDMLADGKSIADEVTDNAKAVARVALGNLGVVSRDEFDGQVAMLRRTRERVEQLESEISTLLIKIDELQNQSSD